MTDKVERNGELIVGGLALAYFGLKALFFALRIRDNLFPDEITHFGLSELFGRSFLPPVDSADSYAFGLITHVPTLYYLLMGKLIHLNLFGVSDLVFLRCCNVAMGMLTVAVAWKLVRRLISDRVARSLFVVLLTNTLMFTFLCAAVNYDNLVNLLAVVALYLLVRYLQEHETGALIGCLAALAAGALTKPAFLPYAFILVVVLIFDRRRALRELGRAPLTYLSARAPLRIAAVAAMLVLLALCVNLYGGNLARYGRLVPRADQVLTTDQAMQNRIFARNRTLSLYRQGRITIEQAQAMASRITHAGDRQGTLTRLRVAQREKARPSPRSDRVTYAFRWSDMMLSHIYGVAAHRMMWRTRGNLFPFRLIWLIALACVVRGLGARHMNGQAAYLAAISAFYVLVLMQGVNYENYAQSGILGAALQGRYLFPVLVPAYALACYYMVGRFSGRVRWGVSLLLAVVFVWNELPWFLEHASEVWFFQN